MDSRTSSGTISGEKVSIVIVLRNSEIISLVEFLVDHSNRRVLLTLPRE
jgi:hypothetical protein